MMTPAQLFGALTTTFLVLLALGYFSWGWVRSYYPKGALWLCFLGLASLLSILLVASSATPDDAQFLRALMPCYTIVGCMNIVVALSDYVERRQYRGNGPGAIIPPQ